jgi:hypothetical protein
MERISRPALGIHRRPRLASIGDREFCAPASYKGSTMSQNALSLDPNFTVLERPPCPKCHGPMTLSDVTSGSAGDMCTFECVICNLTEKVTVETKR